MICTVRCCNLRVVDLLCVLNFPVCFSPLLTHRSFASPNESVNNLRRSFLSRRHQPTTRISHCRSHGCWTTARLHSRYVLLRSQCLGRGIFGRVCDNDADWCTNPFGIILILLFFFTAYVFPQFRTYACVSDVCLFIVCRCSSVSICVKRLFSSCTSSPR